jgi:ribonuclease Z
MTLSDGVTMSDISDGKLTYTKVSYATDTLPFDGLVEKVSGADLAILEGMHHDKNARNGHHMLFGEAATVAKAGKVKELWLTHFSPSLVQPEYGLAETEKIFKNTKCGHQGMRKEIL